jgi:hypothetical protein
MAVSEQNAKIQAVIDRLDHITDISKMVDQKPNSKD